VQPYLAAIDLGDLVKFAVFFFVVVLPIVRTIMEAVKARQAEAARREEQGTSAGAEPESAGDADEDAARRAWEALMRGEEPVREVNEAPPPPVPPMVAPVSRRVEERARREAELTRRVASVQAERPPLDVAARRTQVRPQLLGSREELRRAVLSAEILGRPVALRDH
jgi:flagellar biosynthesis/type III secretory pathway M-ring protein FliF/YscJ